MTRSPQPGSVCDLENCEDPADRLCTIYATGIWDGEPVAPDTRVFTALCQHHWEQCASGQITPRLMLEEPPPPDPKAQP